MTIDCRKSGPVKYKTNADSNFEQFCYYGQNKQDRFFNRFLARKVNQDEHLLVFKINSVINVTKNSETKMYKAVQELKNLVKQNKKMKEVVIDQKLQSNLNSLRENTLEEEKI